MYAYLAIGVQLWRSELERLQFLLQGKYINDPQVLMEAAKNAGVADAEQVLSDPNVAKDQVCSLSLKYFFDYFQ